MGDGGVVHDSGQFANRCVYVSSCAVCNVSQVPKGLTEYAGVAWVQWLVLHFIIERSFVG